MTAAIFVVMTKRTWKIIKEKKPVIGFLFALVAMVLLIWFSVASNKIQIYEVKIGLEATDSIRLDSLDIEMIFLGKDSNNININGFDLVLNFGIRGNKIVKSVPKSYYQHDGYLVDSVYGRINLLVDLKRNDEMVPFYSHYTIFLDSSNAVFSPKAFIHTFENGSNKDFLFLSKERESFPEKFQMEACYSSSFLNLGDGIQCLLSTFNLQRKCIQMKLESQTLDKSKCKVTLDFNKIPISVQSMTEEADKRTFSTLVFDSPPSISTICSEDGLSAIIEILPFEGFQVTKNILIGVLIPLSLTYIIKYARQSYKNMCQRGN